MKIVEFNKNVFAVNDGTISVPGIGFCFPDRTCGKPEDGQYIHVTEVKDMSGNGKSYGFYKWEPAEYHSPTEEELIEEFIRLKSPKFLFCTIEKMEIAGKEAIVLRLPVWERRGYRCALHGLSLNGWPENAVTITADTEIRAREIMPSTPYFPDGRTMLEHMLNHGYGNLTDDELFEFIGKMVAWDENPFTRAMANGWIERGQYWGHEMLFIGANISHEGWSRMTLPVLKEVETWRCDYSTETSGLETKFVNTVEYFVSRYVAGKLGLPPERTCDTYAGGVFPLHARHKEDIPQEALDELPPAVRKAVEQNLIYADYMYPNWWFVDFPNHAAKDAYRRVRMMTILAPEEIKAIIDFTEENNRKSSEELTRRDDMLENLVKTNFYHIIGQVESPKEFSETLETLISKRIVDAYRWGTIDFVIMRADEWEYLFTEFTQDELKALVEEISKINTEANARVASAIKKGKLNPSQVVMY